MKKQSNNTLPATKTDINRLEKSTEADIRTLRTDFKRTEKSLRSESLRIEEQYEHLDDQVKDIKDQLTDLQEGQKRTEGKIDKLTNTVVNFVGRVTLHKLRSCIDFARPGLTRGVPFL